MPETTYAATGRRKTSVARARLTPGDGRITVNNRTFEDYLPLVSQQNQVLAPLHATAQAKKLDIELSATGGGISGQIGAIRLAIARALLQLDPNHRSVLKEQGMLTRDSRMKERKKSGRPGARKRFQFSKR